MHTSLFRSSHLTTARFNGPNKTTLATKSSYLTYTTPVASMNELNSQVRLLATLLKSTHENITPLVEHSKKRAEGGTIHSEILQVTIDAWESEQADFGKQWGTISKQLTDTYQKIQTTNILLNNAKTVLSVERGMPIDDNDNSRVERVIRTTRVYIDCRASLSQLRTQLHESTKSRLDVLKGQLESYDNVNVALQVALIDMNTTTATAAPATQTTVTETPTAAP